jgi:hypothetical protein
MAQTQILETDKQVTVDQAIENYSRIMPPIPIPPKKPIGQLAPPPLK